MKMTEKLLTFNDYLTFFIVYLSINIICNKNISHNFIKHFIFSLTYSLTIKVNRNI